LRRGPPDDGAAVTIRTNASDTDTAERTRRGRGAEIEPLAVTPREACRMMSCGVTRLYEMIAAGEIESYLDGRARRITVASIRARIARLIAAGPAS
jgi:excisionase family DNA binding protein